MKGEFDFSNNENIEKSKFWSLLSFFLYFYVSFLEAPRTHRRTPLSFRDYILEIVNRMPHRKVADALHSQVCNVWTSGAEDSLPLKYKLYIQKTSKTAFDLWWYLNDNNIQRLYAIKETLLDCKVLLGIFKNLEVLQKVFTDLSRL